MVQIIGFMLVVVLVYAVKAAVIVKSHDDIAEKSESFSWMHARSEDEAIAESWAVEEPQVSEASVSLGSLRPAGV